MRTYFSKKQLEILYDYNAEWRLQNETVFITKYNQTVPAEESALNLSINLNETEHFNVYHNKKETTIVDQEKLNYLEYIKRFKADFTTYNTIFLKGVKGKSVYNKDKMKEFETKYFQKYLSERFLLEQLKEEKKKIESNKKKKLFSIIGKKLSKAKTIKLETNSKYRAETETKALTKRTLPNVLKTQSKMRVRTPSMRQFFLD